MILFIKLLLAHLLGDFVLQPTEWVEEKERKKYKSFKLYLHVALHFGLVMLVTMDAVYLPLAAIIAGSHLLIDAVKLQLQNTNNRKWLFAADQVLHIAVIAVAAFYIEGSTVNYPGEWLNEAVVIATGVILLTSPVSMAIKMILSQWTSATETKIDVIETKSLQRAGKVIGYLERLLVFVFILEHQWAAIGFLITAKSVFRFGDLKAGQDRKLTEYILIGTLLSFGIAIITGIAINWILKQMATPV